jgi:hypothetical protein
MYPLDIYKVQIIDLYSNLYIAGRFHLYYLYA